MAPRRAEELLSYLTGLAPVGEPVVIRRDVAMADLRIGNANTYYQCLRHLVDGRFVRRVNTGVVVVLRRPEEFA
ncbi:hypothetical protein [Mesorhizobium sp. B2-4-6]|uniref:hypothetical protein n=1 Tax=Mesorhizobium sp. B2-4-6 TaxID=2589943 RepID=UPI0011288482|nr:hypothetical protein [Mesorhizobium sp. B2-4-6]TPL40665.1 hypothetical protein FJ957_25890 [Mesorhizobium sp. B2-4-6]